MKRLPLKILAFYAISFFFFGCKAIPKSPNNGFYFDRSNEASAGFGANGVDSVALISRVSLQGYFIGFESENGREIHLFIEGKKNKAPDFKRIIASLESNHPSTWSFYYTPWGGNDAAKFWNYIDSTGKFICIASGFDVRLTPSYLSQDKMKSMKRIKRYGYKIWYMYTTKTCFWIGVTRISELNQANSGQRWSWTAIKNRFSREWTGPKTNQPCSRIFTVRYNPYSIRGHLLPLVG